MRALRVAGMVISVAVLGSNAARAAGASTLVVSGITTPRSAGSTASVTVEARTTSGVRATTYTGTIRFTSTDGQAVLPANYTFTAADAGIHTFTNALVLKTAGTQSVTATDTVTAMIKGTQTGIAVNALAVATLNVSGISTPRTAGTASSVRVKALDPFGNMATTYRGTIHFTSSDAAAIPPADYTFTAADAGDHTFAATAAMPGGVVLKTAGSQSVTVTDVANASLTASQTGIIVNAGAGAILVVSGIVSPRTANFASSVTVEVRDAVGNKATGYTGTVHFTSSDATAVLPANYKFTATDAGLHNFTSTTGGTVTLKTPGPQSVTATDTVTASITGNQTGIQVFSNAATSLAVSGFPASAVAGTTATITVEARDRAGNRSTGYTGTVHFASSDTRAVLPADYRFTAGTTCTQSPCDNGIHSFSITLKTSGVESVSATDMVTSTITGTQSGISIAAGPAASLNVSGFPSPATAGIAGTATIEARDAFGNRATGYAGSVQLTATDPIATVPFPVSFASAQGIQAVSVTFRTAGTQSLIVADSTTPSIGGRQDGISVAPASAAALRASVAIPGGTLTAGQSSSATITALDPYGNVATGYVGTVHFSSSDRLATVPADRSFAPADFGSATLSGLVFRTAGAQSFTASDTLGGMSATQSNIPVVAGTAASLVVSGFPSAVSAGIAGAITVTAADTFGNTATGYLGTIAFTASDQQAVLPPPTAFTSADAGARSFAVTLKTAGAQSITVTDSANAALTSSQSGISVAPAAAASLLVSGIPSPITTGASASATVDVRDAFGNRATSYTGTVAFSSSDVQASLPAPYKFVAIDAGLHVFTGAVVLRTFGTQSVTATDTASAAIAGTQSGISVADGIPPTWPAGSTLTATVTSSTSVHLAWTAATDNAAVTAYRLYQDGVLVQTLGATLATDVTGLTVGFIVHFQVQAGDTAGNFTTNGPTAAVATVPPDPMLVAPPIDTSVATNTYDATSFLYSGPNPIQTGVAPGTIQPTRVSLLRGTVHDRAGQPLPAVRISAVGRPEFGQTLTRSDGAFDFAVNGGGLITVKYERSDLLPAQRQVTPEWQDYTTLPDVVLVPMDQLVSIIDMGSTNTQVARGSVSSDDIGSRQATVIFPPGTGAMLNMPDGSMQTVGTLHVRATELTVGPNGPAAMPGPLPPTSAYTYAASFMADEAVQAGATGILFSQPVYAYLENFLAFPVGFAIPSGTYDTAGARWLPESDGKVVLVLSVTNGVADLDTNGDGIADDPATLASLGVTNAELAKLASLYQPGQSLWRIPLQHFSFVDWNVPLGIPDDTTPPDLSPDSGGPPTICSDTEAKCILEVQNQVLGEALPVVGTPYQLYYNSGRVPGRRANYRVNVAMPIPKMVDIARASKLCLPNRTPECQPVTPATSKIRIDSTVTIRVAGRTFVRQTDPAHDPAGTNMAPWLFEWDGRDAYGRELQGEQPLSILSCYNYPGVGYSSPEENAASFGQPALNAAITVYRVVSVFSAVFDVCTTKKASIGGWNVKPAAMGGWTVSVQHMLDVPNRTLYRGDGGTQRVDDLNRYVVNYVAGTGRGAGFGGTITPVSDGVPATSVNLAVPEGIVVGPDGSIYHSDSARGIIARVTPDGLYHIFAGKQFGGGSNADGVLATQANILFGAGLALAADGTLYYVDADMGRIRKITPDGRVLTVAGNGPIGRIGFTRDGTPSLSATLALDRRGQIAVAPDGTLYFAEVANHRVRKVGPDGILRTVAGSGPAPDPQGFGGFSGDGGPALLATLSRPQGVTLGPDGSVYIADSCNQRVRKVTRGGIISTVAGSGFNCQSQTPKFGGDGGPATSAGLGFPFFSMAVAPDSTLFIADFAATTIRRVTPLGIIDTVAGNGFVGPGGPGTGLPGCLGENCPAPTTALGKPESIAIGPAGDLYVGFADNMFRIGHIAAASAKNSVTVTNTLVPSSDASEVYVFDSRGRHLRTLDALTNSQLQLFSYDFLGRLASITDRDGNVTTVQRDARGNPTAIVGPYGQQTTVTVDSDGYLHTVTNPNNELVQFLYTQELADDPHTGGLLSQYTNARGGQSFYEYDSDGFLTKDTPPDGSFITLGRRGVLAPTSVTYQTALGRTKTYAISRLGTGDAETRTSRDPAGLLTTVQRNFDGSTSMAQPDGTSVNSTIIPDPRFGIQAAIASTTTRTPSGLTRTETHSRSVNLSNPNDLLSLTSLIDEVTVNGKTYRSTYDAAAKTITQVTPAGRQAVSTLDAAGRVSKVQFPGVLPVNIQYDVRGRPQVVTQGTRTYTYTYDGLGRLRSVADPLHSVSFGYDGANRPTSSILPDLNSISASYDGNGNLVSLVPSARAAHTFFYQAGDLEQDYTPPSVDPTRSGHVLTSYDLDQKAASVAPTGVTSIVPSYDTVNGRLLGLAFSAGSNSYTYMAASGRIASITAPDGNKLSYAYDGPLLLTTSFSGGPALGTVTRTYDADFRLATEAVTGGQSITFQYANDSLLTATGALGITRAPETGFVTGTTLGSVTDARTYDSFGDEQTYSASSGPITLYSVDYGTRDALGRIVSKTETVLGEQHVYGYAYDAGGRLINVTKDGGPVSHYDYDANGNRLTAPGLTTSPTYDAQDRLLSYGNCTYAYKPDGSLLAKTCPDGTATYDYDSLGNLRGVTLPGGTPISYVIDGQNRRVAKKINGVVVEGFLYRNQLQPTVWLDGSGAVRAQFVYGARASVPEYMIMRGSSYRFITDQIGSVRLVVETSTGAIAQRLDYDEFGNVLADSSPGFQPFGFAAGLRELETGAVHFGARDYEPLLGRWTAKDPLLFGGALLNFYQYAGGDPVNRIDPSGLLDPTGFVPPAMLALAAAQLGIGIASIMYWTGGAALAGAAGFLAGTWFNDVFINPVFWGEPGHFLSPGGPFAQRFNEAQQIIVSWAKQYAIDGIDENDALALVELGNEAGLRCRGPESHEKGKLRNKRHIHVGPINHIPVR